MRAALPKINCLVALSAPPSGANPYFLLHILRDFEPTQHLDLPGGRHTAARSHELPAG
jgi:hypothetical protein